MKMPDIQMPEFCSIGDGSAYETMKEPLVDRSNGEICELEISYTPINGIRIRISMIGEDEHPAEMEVCEYDLESEQAIAIGEALIRWGKDDHGGDTMVTSRNAIMKKEGHR